MPVTPSNVSIISVVDTYEGWLNYSCDSGYQLSAGDQERVCLQHGNWSGTAPICESKIWS